ncbi:MAG: hypothetical protein CEE41_05105 [Hadesarchaea archaeon B3_Hades]|nr:MAG: hypothetical protein CEE41_05105 [Hadesarchaea archaeon B3_Hades]
MRTVKVVTVYMRENLAGAPYFTVRCHRKLKGGKLVSSFGEHLYFPCLEEELTEAIVGAVRKKLKGKIKKKG